MPMTPQLCLSLAASRIHGATLDDLGVSLGKANLPFGLAKILWCQERFGVPVDAAFHATADFAITRNRTRWKQGFAYGGLVTWSGDFIVLDLKPNACGMLAGGLMELPDLEKWKQVAAAGEALYADVEGERAEWDFETSNHFFQIYEAEWTQPHVDAPRFVFLLHGSGDEHRHTLYYDRDDFAFRDRMEICATPWGPLHLLRGDNALEYWRGYGAAEAFAIKRREAFARMVVGEFIPVAHVTHQGLLSRNTMALGCQAAVADSLYPFAQQEELPAYLLTPLPQLSEVLLPHGSGYRLTEPFERVEVVGTTDDERQLVLLGHGGVRKPVDDIRALAFTYRGNETLSLVTDSRRALIAATLNPLFRITAQGFHPIQAR